MEDLDRISWLYELARAQTDHEQQISAELSTRGGLLAALAALLAVGLTEFEHYYGRSFLLIIPVVLLGMGVSCLLYASWGYKLRKAWFGTKVGCVG